MAAGPTAYIDGGAIRLRPLSCDSVGLCTQAAARETAQRAQCGVAALPRILRDREGSLSHRKIRSIKRCTSSEKECDRIAYIRRVGRCDPPSPNFALRSLHDSNALRNAPCLEKAWPCQYRENACASYCESVRHQVRRLSMAPKAFDWK